MDWGDYRLQAPPRRAAIDPLDPCEEPDCCATCARCEELGDGFVCLGRLGELLEARSVLPCMPGEARAVVSAVRDAIVPEGGWCRAWREAEL